jgi:hypothetical protein
MPQSWDMGQMFHFPSEGRHAEDLSTEKIRQLRSGANPRSWVPEGSMLITRQPNLLHHEKVTDKRKLISTLYVVFSIHYIKTNT